MPEVIPLELSKATLAAQVMKRRIAHADHLLTGLPSERQLAQELGFSRNTVRSAVRLLLDEGVLIRRSNGRLSVRQEPAKSAERIIGFVTPPYQSWEYAMWGEGVDHALSGCPAMKRALTYAHWGDPALHEAIAGFDGIFLIPMAEPLPEWLVSKIRDSRCRVVILDRNETVSGLPSVVMFPSFLERKLLDHLFALGHRTIDCLNGQVEDPVIMARIELWRSYLQEKGIGGSLRSLGSRKSVESGYRMVSDAIRDGDQLATAVLCTTGPTAIGAMRAAHDAGMEIGRDISICAVNDEGLGRYMLTSLTALESPNRTDYLHQPLDWMLHSACWNGPLLIQPSDVPLFEGESTGPPPNSPGRARGCST